MGEPLAIETRIAEAETRWPGLQLERQGAKSACGPCPFCGHKTGGADENGFIVFQSGGYLCRKCGKKGWLNENNNEPLDPVKVLELRLAAVERRQVEHDKRLTALEKMASCTDHLRYHQQMDTADLRDWWLDKGFFDETIDAYQLGICYHCRTDQPDERMSFTIPVVNGGQLVNIRHRLIGGSPSDKYRPHRAGLGNTLFGADTVYKEDASSILISEGEKKSIILAQYGFENVGVMGKAGFQKSWASRFFRFDEVLIALDPDATDRAYEMAAWFDGKARVVDLPVKSDDFFTEYHGTAAQFNEFLRMARRVH